MDFRTFLFDLNLEQRRFLAPSALGGITVTFFTLIIITLAPLLAKNEKHFSVAIIALAIGELWFCVPKGFDTYCLYLKLIPFFAGTIGILLLARRRIYFAALAFLFVPITHVYLDFKTPQGLPNRYDPFKLPPYANFLKNSGEFSRIVALDGILMPNFSGAFGLHDIRYINALSVKDYNTYMGCLFPFYAEYAKASSSLWFTGVPASEDDSVISTIETLWDNMHYLSLMGVEYVVTPRNIDNENFPPVYRGEVNIFRPPFWLPRTFIARQVRYESSPEQAIDMIRHLGSAIQNTIILEKKIPDRYITNAHPHDIHSQVSILEYGVNEVIIQAATEKPGILVLTDVFYPGWKAYVDGKPSEIFRVNGLVRGVLLDKGNHTVVFRYLPPTFLAGLILAVLSFITCIMLFCLGSKRAAVTK
jgi:hypothetical protein